MSTRGDGETVNVRRATVADAATISALNADVQAVHAAALPWLFKTPSAETFPPATAAAMLARHDVLVYLAYLGDAPSVLPSLRGRGIGGCRWSSSNQRSAPDARRRRNLREQPGHPSSASSPRWRCWLWPAKPVFERPSTCRQPVLLSATSPEGQMAFGHRAQRSCW